MQICNAVVPFSQKVLEKTPCLHYLVFVLLMKQSTMKKICIVVNKNWEGEPMLAALCSAQFRPIGLPFPEVLLSVQDNGYRVDPAKPINDDSNARAIIRFHQNNDKTQPVILEARVWCIQDFMDTKKSSSSSEEKFRFLPNLLAKEAPDMVVAVGTAGYLSSNPIAGCVSVGSRFFIHNGHPGNPASNMQSKLFDTLLPQNVNPEIFSIFSPTFKLATEPKFLKTPNSPAQRAAVLASQHYTALSSVNVTDYSEYAWVDGETIDEFRKVEGKLPVGSLETTHGVIRLSSDAPAIFVSAITDREGEFDIEVTAAQNYTASFNTGIVIGQFLVDLNDKLIKNPGFAFKQLVV